MDHHKKSVNKFTADDRFFSAIGRFIFEFSQLEYTLKHHVAEQVDLKDEYFTAVMVHDFAALLTMIVHEVMGSPVSGFFHLSHRPAKLSTPPSGLAIHS
jgi:hypothetical protein